MLLVVYAMAITSENGYVCKKAVLHSFENYVPMINCRLNGELVNSVNLSERQTLVSVKYPSWTVDIFFASA